MNAKTTILVLHSGNHELIGIRHRKRRTLYITDIIEPWKCENPGYGKIQAGIYIAAIQDALDRAEQEDQEALRSKNPEGNGHPDEVKKEDNHPPRRGERRKRGGGAGARQRGARGNTTIHNNKMAHLKQVTPVSKV